MTSSSEARRVAVEVSGAYVDLVTALSGGEAAHAHEHLVKHLQMVALTRRDQLAVQTGFALQALDLLMGRVLADPPDRDAADGRDCARANEFVTQVVRVMAGALGASS